MNKKSKFNVWDFLFQNKVVLMFLVLCIGATIASKQPLTFVIPELFTRIARNSFIVLSLIIPVIAGMGLNFGIVIGAMAAQVTGDFRNADLVAVEGLQLVTLLGR